FAAPPAAVPTTGSSLLFNALAAIDPDSLTAKEALDALYHLKQLQQKEGIP
ncbi:MAG: hypothetical protein H7Z19_14345, partial [Chitinophagaceae bacterium]|nr:hypothetical protein [Rubrivivax sp.]